MHPHTHQTQKQGFLFVIPYFVLVYFCFFGPRLTFIDTHVVAGLLAACVGGIALLRNLQKYKGIAIFVALQILPLFYLLVIQFASGTYALRQEGNFSILKMSLWAFTAIGLFSLAEYLRGRERGYIFLLKCIVLSAAINALTVIPMLIGTTRNIILNYVVFVRDASFFVTRGSRIMDIGIGGTDATAAAYCSMLLVALYLFRLTKGKHARILLLIQIAIIIAMASLAARTGQIIILTFLVIFLLIKIFGYVPRDHSSRSIFRILLISLTSVALLAVAVVIIVPRFFEHSAIANELLATFGKVWERASRLFRSDESAIETTNTFLVLWDMWTKRWPSGAHLFFGDGNFGRLPMFAYVYADPGWVRIVYGMGIFGAALFVIPYWYAIRLALRIRKIDWSADLCLGVIYVIMIANIKAWSFGLKALGLMMMVTLCAVVASPARKFIVARHQPIPPHNRPPYPPHHHLPPHIQERRPPMPPRPPRH